MFTGGLGDVTVGEDVFDYLDLLRKGQWRRLSDELRAHGRLWGWPETRPGARCTCRGPSGRLCLAAASDAAT